MLVHCMDNIVLTEFDKYLQKDSKRLYMQTLLHRK